MGNECPQCSGPVEKCNMRDVFKQLPKNRQDLDLSHIKKQQAIRRQKSLDQDQSTSNSLIVIKNQLVSTDKHSKLQKSTLVKDKEELNSSPIHAISQPLSLEKATIKTVQLRNGAKYIGGFLEGNPHEKGKVIWQDGTTLNGHFFLGQLTDNQKVVIRTKQNCVYQGHIKQGKANGKGKLTMNDGTFYEGQWIKDVPNGFGKHQMSDGSVYEGMFKEAVKSGLGKLQFKEGMYEGEFQNDQFHGEGILILYNDRKIKGKWNNGVLEGEGEVQWQSGDKYVGSFKNGMREGQGTYFFQDGRQWKGEWQNDLQHGFGCYTVDQQMIKGVWVNGIKKDQMRQFDVNASSKPSKEKSNFKQSQILI